MSIDYLNILTKQTGDKLTAREFNTTKDKINEIIDSLNDVEPSMRTIIAQYLAEDEVEVMTSQDYGRIPHSNDKVYVCVDNGEITSVNVGDLSIVGEDISPSLNSYVLNLIQQANNAAERAERAASGEMTYDLVGYYDIDLIMSN